MNGKELIGDSFLKDAIDRIAQLGHAAKDMTFHTVGKTEFVFDKDGNSEILEEPFYTPSTTRVTSLDALVNLIRTEAVKNYTNSPIYVNAAEYGGVSVYLQPEAANKMKRAMLYLAQATDVPGFRDTKYSFEEAMIALRSQFQQTDDIKYMLNLLSHMASDQSVKSDDNGVTQTVQVKRGVSFVDNEEVRPIVALAPYRTFQEVEQPISEFVFRVDNERNITLAEADGGMWKLTARRTVCQYLTDALTDEIAAGRVFVSL